MAISAIVAVAKNFAIGRGGKLPWHYSADLKFFKETTTGNAVVMGSTTWRSIGKPLPNRLNVVLSRSRDFATPPGVYIVRDREQVITLARQLKPEEYARGGPVLRSNEETTEFKEYLNRDVYIIGGAKVFETFADVIDEWIVTQVPDMVENADVFMPADFLNDFDQTASLELEPGLSVRRFKRIKFRYKIEENRKENTNMMGGRTWDDWIEEYSESHQNPVNRLMHTFGIPMIALSVLSVPLCFFVGGLWRIALGLFVVGWILQ